MLTSDHSPAYRQVLRFIMPKTIKIERRIYLDWAASAPVLPSAAEAACYITNELFGNPSSIHQEGRTAKERLESARSLLADCLGAEKGEIYFTSSATEANQLVLASILAKFLSSPRQGKRPQIIISEIEHASLWEGAMALKRYGFEILTLRPKADGIIDPETLAKLLSEDTTLVALMLVNNETGAIQPVADFAQLIKKWSQKSSRRIHFHCDAAQAFGKLYFSFSQLGVDSLAVSAHKLGGLRGAGALVLKKQSHLLPLFPGGGQEANLRSGTENLAAIVAFSEAACLRIKNLESSLVRVRYLMQELISNLTKITDVHLVPEERAKAKLDLFSPYILTITAPPIPGEVLLRHLDEAGIAVSTGSACRTYKDQKNRVLEAMGLNPLTTRSAIRLSIGPETTKEEIDIFLEVIGELLPYLKKIS